MVLSRKLQQAVRRVTSREGGGGGCCLPGEVCTKTGQPFADFIWEKHLDMRVSPVENPTCTAFDEYKEVPEIMLLDFSEENITWVASKLSGAAGVLGEEAIELRNWLLFFGCESEEFRVVVANLKDWMANSTPPWDDYRSLMACCLDALDKRPRVIPIGIEETFCQSIAKLLISAAGDQAKTACGSL